MVDYARLLLAQALIETPDAEERDIRSLLEGCQRGFRQRRKTRALLLALALEMELRSRPGSTAPLEPVRLGVRGAGRARPDRPASRRSGCGPSWPPAAALLRQGRVGRGGGARQGRRGTGRGRRPRRRTEPGRWESSARRWTAWASADEARQARSEGARLLDEAAGAIEDADGPAQLPRARGPRRRARARRAAAGGRRSAPDGAVRDDPRAQLRDRPGRLAGVDPRHGAARRVGGARHDPALRRSPRGLLRGAAGAQPGAGDRVGRRGVQPQHRGPGRRGRSILALERGQGRAVPRPQERQPVRHPLADVRSAAVAGPDHRHGLPGQPARGHAVHARATCASSRRSPTTRRWRCRTPGSAPTWCARTGGCARWPRTGCASATSWAARRRCSRSST